MSIDPAFAIVIALAMLCFLIVAAVFLIVGHDRRRVRVDPMMAAHGDYPGFSREQLQRFQSDIHGARRTGGAL